MESAELYEMAIYVTRDALITALIVVVPMLLAALLIGFVISIFQAVTQINEMTLTFVPKIIGVAVVGVIALPWIAGRIVAFAIRVFGYVGGAPM